MGSEIVRCGATGCGLRRVLASVLLATGLALVVVPAVAQTQDRVSVRTPFSTELLPQWLSEVLPQAESFTEKAGEPPVISGYRRDGQGNQVLAGFVFLSSDVPPEEKGYSAPVAMLIGMDTDLNITGLKILDYRDSYRYTRGDFMADPRFLSQFPGKSIGDEFRLAQDIDGLSGATISSFGITRGAREAARRVAATYLGYQAGDAESRRWTFNARERLAQRNWQDLIEDGTVQQVTIQMPVGELTLAITYMGRPVLGSYLIGESAYARAERDASTHLGNQEMILVAVGGSAAAQFRMERLALQLGEASLQSINPTRFVSAGNADEGAIAGQAAYAGAIVLDEGFDLTQPFLVAYRPPGQIEPVTIPYRVDGLNLTLALDEPVLSTRELERQARLESGILAQLQYGPPWLNDSATDTPWSATPWSELLMLFVVFSAVLAAFFTKRARLRQAALVLTVAYLGFIEGGFLSVSHITSVIGQGVGPIVGNIPLLLLVLFTLVTTLLWGRVFCSSLCPFGAIQDFITWLTPRRWRVRVPMKVHERAYWIKYGFLGVILLAAVFAAQVSLFQYFEPFGTLFFLRGSLLLWAILAAVLVGSVLVPRFYCRYLCPLGAALGALSVVSPLRIRRVPQCQVCSVCEHACPTGAIKGAEINFRECVRCDVCESKLIARVGSCRHDVEVINLRLRHAAPIVVPHDAA